MEYIRLAEGLHFTINKVMGFKYKMWDVGGKKMVSQDQWFDGSTKKWQVETEKGMLDLSNAQLSQCLVATFNVQTQSCQLQGAKFEVKTNGKTGMEIRYFFNVVDAYKEAPKTQAPAKDYYPDQDFPV